MLSKQDNKRTISGQKLTDTATIQSRVLNNGKLLSTCEITNN